MVGILVAHQEGKFWSEAEGFVFLSREEGLWSGIELRLRFVFVGIG